MEYSSRSVRRARGLGLGGDGGRECGADCATNSGGRATFGGHGVITASTHQFDTVCAVPSRA